MGQNERIGLSAEPAPTELVLEPTQVHIVEATPPPVFPDLPTAPAIADGSTDPTTVVPVQTLPVQPVAYAAITPVHTDEAFIEDRRPVWPYVAAALALLLGGLVGFLVGTASNDQPTSSAVSAPSGDAASTFDMLLARTKADGEYKSPSEYPQLDQITAIDNAAATANLQQQVDMLTAAQGQAKGLAGQVTTLTASVADLTAQRDALAAQVAANGGTSSDQQAKLDAANAKLDSLTNDLSAARADLDSANASLTKAQNDLAVAKAAYDALHVTQAPDYVNADIAGVRTQAAANGWTLLEQPTDSTTVAAGTVLDQVPAAGTNMVEGSVLYVRVAKRP